MRKLFVLFLLLLVVACSSDDSSELVEVDDPVQNEENEIEEQSNEDEELKELTAKKAELESEIQDLLNRSAELTKSIEDKENILNQLEGSVAQKEEEPIKLNAGYYYFGEDVPSGRYKLMPQEGNRGNVFIRGVDGISYVSETFGHSEDTLQEFTFKSSDGDEIEATIPVILLPVE